MENPIIELATKIQKKYGENIETRVIDKLGPDHCPEIHVEILLPDGSVFHGKGNNQKIAKQNAARKALKDLS